MRSLIRNANGATDKRNLAVGTATFLTIVLG
jgi:hypothetical protein